MSKNSSDQRHQSCTQRAVLWFFCVIPPSVSASPDSKGVRPKANIPESKVPADEAAAAIATEGIPMMKKGRAAA